MHRFGCRHSAVGGRGDKLANVLDAIVACHKNALCFGAAILRRDRIACAVQLDQGRKGLILGDPAHGDKQSADLQGSFSAVASSPRKASRRWIRYTFSAISAI